MNIRFNAGTAEALKSFAAGQFDKIIRLKVLARG